MFPRASVSHDQVDGDSEPLVRERAGGWLQWPLQRRGSRLRLLCFHPAGVGAASYRAWGSGFPENIEVAAVQLPGRANRLAEPPLTTIAAIVDALIASIGPQLTQPFAFFGHSMGAVIAHELACALRERGLPLPVQLVVSGRRAPSLPDPFPPLRHLSDEAFVSEINRRYNAIPAEILEHKDVLQLLLPCLRADIAALEDFTPAARAPLDIPIAAFGGDSDRQTPAVQLEPWRDLTSRDFSIRVFPGGHFYLDPLRDEVIAAVNSLLQPHATRTEGAPQQ